MLLVICALPADTIAGPGLCISRKKQIGCHIFMRQLISIGAARFELATSRPPAVRATKLRHTP